MTSTPVGDVYRHIDDGIVWITLNRPEASNALTRAMRDQISEWIREASSDLFVRVAVITGAGNRDFCTGADLRAGKPELESRPEGAPEHTMGDKARTIRDGWQRLVGSIIDCEKPVIAAVNGTAAGGGMHLALACDMVVAAAESRFIEVFVRRGLAPDAGGAWILSRLVGIQKAKELFFLGDDVPAVEAYRLGLVNRIVPRAELRATVAELASRLADSPTKALGMAKWLTNRSLDVDRYTSFQEEALAQELISHTEDSKEGTASFLERRPSAFKGW